MLVFLVAGCDSKPPAPAEVPTKPAAETPSKPTITAVVDPGPPGVVELIGAKAHLDQDGFVRFEVNYRFTSGSPTRHYMLDITFPDTKNRGVKPMQSWEVKPEGIIKTRIQVSDPPVKQYSMNFSEADSPQQGYKVISNTLTGEIEPLPETK